MLPAEALGANGFLASSEFWRLPVLLGLRLTAAVLAAGCLKTLPPPLWGHIPLGPAG